MTESAGSSQSELEQKALARLKGNRRSGYDPFYKYRYEYSIPSPGRYMWQWFWDSCFHAIALARLDPEMAKRELESLFITQRKDGFIGHLIYWGRRGTFLSAIYMQGRFNEARRRHSAMIQPPLLAQAVEAVFRATGDRDFLRHALTRTLDYYRWISRERDPDGTGLFAIISPYECGLDNSPVFDAPLGLRNPGRRQLLLANRRLDLHNLFRGNFNYSRLRKLRGFDVVDPLMNAIYADGLRSLERLCHEGGMQAESEEAAAMARKTEDAINRDMWDEERGCFVYLSGQERARLTTLTAGSIMPLITETLPRDRADRLVLQHLLNDEEFWTPLPVPSVPRSEPTYDPVGEASIWRGPVCMNLNWFFVRGLRLHGFTAIADEIAEKSRAAASAEFREFYSPETARGMRGTNFGWATVAVDMSP